MSYHKEIVFVKDNSVCDSEAIFNAMRNLKSTAFKLWLYLVTNRDGFQRLSEKCACTTCGIGKSSYYEAFKELISKCYLVQDEQNKDYYEFFEVPYYNEHINTDNERCNRTGSQGS